MIERRFVKGAQVRAKQGGKPGIEGYGAVFGEQYVLWDSPTMRIVETVAPGTFARALQEKQDVRCLFNHQPDNILGRSANGTLNMNEDSTGLHYDADFDMRTRIGNDVRCFVDRGDVTGCSFSFQVTKQVRTEVEDNDKLIISREIQDVDLYDVGPVTYPAYEGTSVKARSVELRSLFPDGVSAAARAHAPAELRDLIDLGPIPAALSVRDDADPNDPDNDDPDDTDPDNDPDDPDDNDVEDCACRCRACYDGDHEDCDDYMATCPDAQNCGNMAGMRAASLMREKRDGAKTKRVDGEDLTASAFAYVGDPNDTSTWKLPIKFSTPDKTASHVRNALARFSQTNGIPDSEKPKVLAKLKAAAKACGIHVADESNAAETIALELAKAKTDTLTAELSL
jgi:HK97 family phage prohead protease